MGVRGGGPSRYAQIKTAGGRDRQACTVLIAACCVPAFGMANLTAWRTHAFAHCIQETNELRALRPVKTTKISYVRLASATQTDTTRCTRFLRRGTLRSSWQLDGTFPWLRLALLGLNQHRNQSLRPWSQGTWRDSPDGRRWATGKQPTKGTGRKAGDNKYRSWGGVCRHGTIW
jgi:hypothetical protein